MFLGLIASAGIAYGGWRAMEEEGTSFGDQADRLQVPAVPVPGPAPARGTAAAAAARGPAAAAAAAGRRRRPSGPAA